MRVLIITTAILLMQGLIIAFFAGATRKEDEDEGKYPNIRG